MRRVFAQAKDSAVLARGRFLGPILSNQLQGYAGLQPHLDYRTADPKPYVTYFPGLVSHNDVQLQVHLLNSDNAQSSRVINVTNNSSITPTHLLPKEQESNSTGHRPLHTFGRTTTATFGDLVYSRSGDKGANVNVGFFFPMGKDMKTKWEWLRSFLTRERFCGMSRWQLIHD
jgi:hypothetical protein